MTFENGTSALSLWQDDDEAFYSNKTNQLIIAAAVYALSVSLYEAKTILVPLVPAIIFLILIARQVGGDDRS